MVAAAMRARDTKDPYYLQSAMREWKFLLQWFNFPNDTTSLLNSLDPVIDGPAVVRERVSTYFDKHEDFYFSSDLAWAGDQGLILGGLLRLIDATAQSHSDEQAMLDLARRITDGFLVYLSDGVRFFPWSITKHPTQATIGDAPSGDTNDYSAGIGVYMRYLLYAYRANAEMRQHLENAGYRDLVRKFAEDFAAQDQGLCYPAPDPKKHCDDLVILTNKLAALVAAIEMKRRPWWPQWR